MAEISKGKRSTGRRSSILKRALADIDVNMREKTEVTRSKRVSFAETCCIKEFPRDSPQVLKAAEHNDSADTSADSSLQDPDMTSNADDLPKQEVAQPLPDILADSSFILDDGETTFIGNMVNLGDFCESTRRFDRIDSCAFGEAGGLNVSDITQGENSVFMSAPPVRSSSMAASTSTMLTGNKCPGGGNTMAISQPHFQPVDRPAMQQQQAALTGDPEMDFVSEGDRTVMFDNQDGGTMDLTLVGTSRTDFTFQYSPKVSVHDFSKSVGYRMGSEGPQAREEQHTIVFSNMGVGGSGMELTQNLSLHNFTDDFRVVPQAHKLPAALQSSMSDDESLGFGARNDDLNTSEVPKISAKAFLATLQRNKSAMPAAVVVPNPTTLSVPGSIGSSTVVQGEQGEDADVTMELTCLDPFSKPIIQTLSASRIFQPVSCKTQNGHQEELEDGVQNEEDITEMMELTGRIDNTLKLLVEANSSAINAVSVSAQEEISKSSGQTRNALMDITARYSVSQTPSTQYMVETEKVCTMAAENMSKPVEPASSFISPAQNYTKSDLPYTLSSTLASGSATKSDRQSTTPTVFTGQENTDSQTRSVAAVNHHGIQMPLKPVQKERPAPSVPVVHWINSTECTYNNQHPLSSQGASDQTVHFDADEDMEKINGFVSSTDDQVGTSIRSNQVTACPTPAIQSTHTVNRRQSNLTMMTGCEQITVCGKDEARERSCNTKKEKDENRKGCHEKSIAFNPEDTAANMSLTCTTLPQGKISENKTVVFEKEDSINMSLTCAIAEPSAPVDKYGLHKSILFGEEETGANMSLTCTSLPSKVKHDRSIVNRNVQFKMERTGISMSLTSTDLRPLNERSIMFKPDNTAANMSLTCANLSWVQPDCGDMQTTNLASTHNHQLPEKTIVFAKEASTANMSLTCADLPAMEQEKTPGHEESQTATFKLDHGDNTQNRNMILYNKHQWSDKSIVFAKEATAANMSLTCADLPALQHVEQKKTSEHEESQAATSRSDHGDNTQNRNMIPHDKHQWSDKSIVFAKEATAANMSLTCADLPALQHVEQKKTPEHEESQTVTFKSDDGDNTQNGNMIPYDKHQWSDKSIVVAKEATAANMSLTCADLPALQHMEEKKTPEHQESQTVTFKSDHGDNTQNINMIPHDKHQWSDKSIVFAKEATAANMSLTCADLPALQHMEQKKKTGHEESQTTTFKSDDGDNTQNRNMIPYDKHQWSDKNIVFAKEATAANMSLTCADLPALQHVEQKKTAEHEGSQAATSKSDHGDNIQNRNMILYNKHQCSDKSIVFAKEATAANMSLTCADLPALQHMKQKTKTGHEESQTTTSKSDDGDNIQNRNMILYNKHQCSDKSIVFAKEATAANMSLICADLSALQNTENKCKPTPCKEESQTTTFKCRPTRHKEEDKMDTLQPSHSRTASESKKMKSVKQGESIVLLPDDAAVKQQQSEILVPEKASAQKHALSPVENASNPQKSAFAQSTVVSNHGEGYLVEEAQEEADDVFVKKGPTRLMEITSVLENLRKKMEEGGSPEEMGAGNVTAENEMTGCSSSSTEQPKPETIKTASSRKLQLSATPGVKKVNDISNSQMILKEQSAFFSNPSKRPLEGFSTKHEPRPKTLRLSGQMASDAPRACVLATSKEPEPQPSVLKVEEKVKASITPASESKDPTRTSLMPMLSQSSSSGSNSSSSAVSMDIFSETMPVLDLAPSNTSGASTSVMSVLATHNTTGSFLSLGRSFVEKQEKVEEASSFFQQLGITQSDLKGWVCRSSNMAVIPEMSCDTVEDQLNSASVVRQECEFKVEFACAVDAILQREQMASEELEKTAMRQISQFGLVAESEQSPLVQQQIRRLLFSSRKHAQVQWKTHKAEVLNILTQKMEKRNQAVSADMEDMTTSIEHMVTLKEHVNENISRLQSQLDSIRSQISSRKQGSVHNLKQQELQQQSSELISLQEQVSETKRSLEQLSQEEKDLQTETECTRQRHRTNMEQQRQLAHSHDTLSALHCLHCWRPVRMEEQHIDFSLLYDAVLLSVTLTGSTSPLQPVANITVTSRIKEGTEPWAVLATELTVDTLSSTSQSLVCRFPSRQHLQSLLEEVTRLVEDIKGLCQEVKLASLRYHITTKGKQITARLWNTEHLRKVSLETDVPISSYPHSPLTWSTQVIMGDISDGQLQTMISEVGPGREHFTRVLQAVQALLQQ